MHPDDAPPVNPLPPVVWMLFIPLFAIEVMFLAAAQGFIGGPEGVGWRLQATLQYGFFDPVLEQMWARFSWPLEHVMRFVTYPFIHHNFTHAMFAGVILLAMGKMVGEVMGNLAVAAIFFGASIGGAVVFSVLLDVGNLPLIGAMPGVYGLIGGFTWILWRNLAAVGAQQARAFSLIGFLMGIQLVFGLLFGSDSTWVAELAGFCTGFALSFVVAPGGMRRMLERTRRD